MPRTGTNMDRGAAIYPWFCASWAAGTPFASATTGPREQLQAHKARALQQLREYAYAHSPFHRRFHAGRTDHPLRELPVLTKAMAIEHFDQLVTDPAVTLAESRPTWPPLRAASASMAATGWRPPRARPAGAGSSCGTWTSGSPCWPPTTGPWTGPAPPSA